MLSQSLSYFKPEVSQLQEYIVLMIQIFQRNPHSSFRGQEDQMEFPSHRPRTGQDWKLQLNHRKKSLYQGNF